MLAEQQRTRNALPCRGKALLLADSAVLAHSAQIACRCAGLLE